MIRSVLETLAGLSLAQWGGLAVLVFGVSVLAGEHLRKGR